jgi:hypothetical protein
MIKDLLKEPGIIVPIFFGVLALIAYTMMVSEDNIRHLM